MSRQRRRAPIGQQETLRQRTARRSGRVIAFSRKHGGSVVSWTGLAGLGVCAGMWAFTGTVYLLAGSMCAVGAIGGAALAHHQRNDVVNGPNSQRVSWRQRQHAEDAYRRGEEFDPGNRTVTVQSHARDGAGVRAYTRAAPNQARTAPTMTASWVGAGRFGGRSDGSSGRDASGAYVPPQHWSNPRGTDTHDSEGQPYGEQVRGFPGWVRGETHPDGRPMSDREKRNVRAYEAWKADPTAGGDYWDHTRGRAITEDELREDQRNRHSWNHRFSVFEDEHTGAWQDAWGRPVDDPEVRRDRSRPGDDPETWT